MLQNSQENINTRVSFSIIGRMEACAFIKKETPVGVFSCKFCKFLSTPILKNIFERISLDIGYVTK